MGASSSSHISVNFIKTNGIRNSLICHWLLSIVRKFQEFKEQLHCDEIAVSIGSMRPAKISATNYGILKTFYKSVLADRLMSINNEFSSGSHREWRIVEQSDMEQFRPEIRRDFAGKMFRKSGFITSHLKKFLKILRCEVMNPEFSNIFSVSSRGFSGQFPVGIVPSSIG